MRDPIVITRPAANTYPDADYVLAYHGTTATAAESIISDGFNADRAVWVSLHEEAVIAHAADRTRRAGTDAAVVTLLVPKAVIFTTDLRDPLGVYKISPRDLHRVELLPGVYAFDPAAVDVETHHARLRDFARGAALPLDKNGA